MDTLALHKALLRPEAYPEGSRPISFRETHISFLYFTPTQVYKVKKPVDFGFLNFTTLDRRRFYCHEEVLLNSRSCPGTYCGVVEIRRQGESVAIGGPGEVVDYAVLMHRLPEERMLARLLRKNDPELPSEIGRIAEKIAALHAGAEICRMDGGQSNLEIVRTNWRENFIQTTPFIGRTLSEEGHALCSSYVRTFLESNAPRFNDREEQGFVRDGHGDLHVEHICLTDPVCIYDCIEFSRRFRVADVAADLAFLLMDLEFRDRSDLARLLLDRYLEACGGDPGMAPLLPFYKVYRAFVRGKVESFLSKDATDEGQRTESALLARRYFNLALGYLCPPVLILTCGRMGVGKTTLARALAKALGAKLLRSDVVRKELAGLTPSTPCRLPYGEGIYGGDFSRRTYSALLSAALTSQEASRTVIVDASFAHACDRTRFAEEAEKNGRPCFLLHMFCDQGTALRRLDRRQAGEIDASDGRRDLFRRQDAAFEAVNDGADVIPVDTANPVDYNVQFILCALLERTGALS